VQQQRAEVHDVEAPELGGVEVVDAALDERHPRAERPVGHREARPRALAGGQGADDLGVAPDGPVPALGVGEVDGHHIGRPAALHREGPEAVEGADVEAAEPVERGQRDPVHDRAQVEPAGGDHAGRQVERVVPLAPGDLLAQPGDVHR